MPIRILCIAWFKLVLLAVLACCCCGWADVLLLSFWAFCGAALEECGTTISAPPWLHIFTMLFGALSELYIWKLRFCNN